MMGLRTLKPGDGLSDVAPGAALPPAMGAKVDRRSVSRDATASPGQARPAGGATKAVLSNSGPEGTIFYDVHIFYYSWYGSPHMDGKYIHWDHILVPHWDPKIASSYPRGRHTPPEDVGSSFYPDLNPILYTIRNNEAGPLKPYRPDRWIREGGRLTMLG
ncbi:hypothetical protein F2P81_002475 [Scophthalmus maximus]|uniref:Uncharacterized protein n=1 Tax=Scophthalmus maximus TaxID=52904 RepID=A0A6A4TEH1_SCOMX|nr:hypothetical protein F2P81_002475 [Scophthalmus maximus]